MDVLGEGDWNDEARHGTAWHSCLVQPARLLRVAPARLNREGPSMPMGALVRWEVATRPNPIVVL